MIGAGVKGFITNGYEEVGWFCWFTVKVGTFCYCYCDVWNEIGLEFGIAPGVEIGAGVNLNYGIPDY